MIRRIAVTFVFFAGLSASYAMATPKQTLSPVMQCLSNCTGGGNSLDACVGVCVPD
jgi:hypothetical protein